MVTINKIIDQVFPKIKTSLSITEILNYAKSFAKYKIAETTGFPMEKTTDTIPGKGSIVIPTDLLTNVKMLHEFLYGTVDYQPSAKVRSRQSLGQASQTAAQSNQGERLVRHRRIRIIIIVIIITAMAMIAVRKVQASRSRRKNR